MELSELKLVVASNLIKLRTGAGMTQAELGAKINYSDKSISKWERADAIPDAYVLLQLASIFGVTVDYILSSHDKWEPPAANIDPDKQPRYSVNMIIAIVIIAIMTIDLSIFVVLWMAIDRLVPLVFLPGITVSVLVYFILDCTLKKGRYLPYALSLFIICFFVCVYVFVPQVNWQFFLLLIPAIAIVFMACNVKRKKRQLPLKDTGDEPQPVETADREA